MWASIPWSLRICYAVCLKRSGTPRERRAKNSSAGAGSRERKPMRASYGMLSHTNVCHAERRTRLRSKLVRSRSIPTQSVLPQGGIPRCARSDISVFGPRTFSNCSELFQMHYRDAGSRIARPDCADRRAASRISVTVTFVSSADSWSGLTPSMITART